MDEPVPIRTGRCVAFKYEVGYADNAERVLARPSLAVEMPSLAKMPQEVVQSNWYYGNDFTEKDSYHTFYEKFAMAGYDQIPAGSNWSYQENFKLTIDFVKRLPQEHILGFEQTVWFPTLNARMNRHEGAIQALAEAKQAYEAN